MATSERVGICAFCGNEGPVTDDHVPPKGIFPPPRPNGLITVDGCAECNEGFSRDDEYFRVVMGLHGQLVGAPAVDRLRPDIMRGLERPEAPGLKKAIEASYETIRLYGPDGKVVVEDDVFSAEADRLNMVVIKTTAGLYSKAFGQRLDPRGYVGSQLAARLALDRVPLAELHAALLAQVPAFHWPHVYSARVLPVEGQPQHSVWWHTFYDRLEFLAVTVPEEVYNRG